MTRPLKAAAALACLVAAGWAIRTAPTTHAANEIVSVWMTTTDQTRLLAQQPSVTFGPDTGTAQAIDVNEGTTYQTIDGFGTSLTDSSAWLIWNRMSAAQRTTLLNNLFHPTTGI